MPRHTPMPSHHPRPPFARVRAQHKLFFHIGGRVSGPLGSGKWSATGANTVSLQLCGSSTLTFDSAESPTSFTVGGGGMRGSSLGKSGAVDPAFAKPSARSQLWETEKAASHLGVQRLLGTGPWAWAGISTMAFLDSGVLVTPWGQGTWYPAEPDDTVVLSFAGAKHRVVAHGCHKFTSVRESDEQRVEGWIQLSSARGGCPTRGFFG